MSDELRELYHEDFAIWERVKRHAAATSAHVALKQQLAALKPRAPGLPRAGVRPSCAGGGGARAWPCAAHGSDAAAL